MITQPNLGCVIMVTIKMIASIARADATMCIFFVDGAIADRLIDFDCLEEGEESRLVRTSTPKSLKEGGKMLKNRVGVMHLFCGAGSQALGSLDE